MKDKLQKMLIELNALYDNATSSDVVGIEDDILAAIDALTDAVNYTPDSPSFDPQKEWGTWNKTMTGCR